MSPGTLSEGKLEIGHVLVIDIVGYSKLLITEQTNQLRTLREIVRGTPDFALSVRGRSSPNGSVMTSCLEHTLEGLHKAGLEVAPEKLARPNEGS